MDSLRDILSIFLLIIYFLLILSLLAKRKVLSQHIYIITIAVSITLITEVFAFVMDKFYNEISTVPYYIINIVGIVYFLYLLFFYKQVENHILKKIQLLLLLLHLLNYTISAVSMANFFTSFPDVTNFISIFLLLFSVAVFLQDTFNSDKILQLKVYYPFYVAVAITLIYVGLIPILYFSKRITLPSEVFVFYIILYSINFIGYSIMLAGVYLVNKNKSVNFRE